MIITAGITFLILYCGSGSGSGDVGFINEATANADALPPANRTNSTYVNGSSSSSSSSIAAAATDIIFEYKRRICTGEPTCHLIKRVPLEMRTLKVRNCMCDEDCVRYNDCCEDSAYYSGAAHRLKQSVPLFHCDNMEKVYMMTSCPSNFTITSIRWRCESSKEAFRGANKKIFIPVTDVQNGVTYGNEYCAVCNGVYDYRAWNVSAHCSLAKSTAADSTAAAAEKLFPSANRRKEKEEEVEEAEADSARQWQKFYSETELLEEVKKRIRYDVNAKAFLSSYNGISYDCWYTRVKPTDLIPHVRYCVEFSSGCVLDGGGGSSDKLTEEEVRCLSYTSIVFDEYGKAYKNADCAATCNGRTTFGPEVGLLKHCTRQR